MTSTQQFWAPIPTTIVSSTPIDNATAAENISTFLQIHHGELPGDSNATASLVRLIQGLRDSSRSSTRAVEIAETPRSPEKKKKKRKHDKVDENASIVADTTAEAVVDESTMQGGEEPVKKKKKKDKKDKKEKKEKKEKKLKEAQTGDE